MLEYELRYPGKSRTCYQDCSCHLLIIYLHYVEQFFPYQECNMAQYYVASIM